MSNDKIFWHCLKPLKQIVDENPTMISINEYELFQLNDASSKMMWTFNSDMIDMLGDGIEYPFVIFEDNMKWMYYTHALQLDHITWKHNISGHWSFHEDWFMDKNEVDFGITDEDFKIL